RFNKSPAIAARFEFEKFPIRLAFFFEIAVNRDPPVLDNQYLFAALFNVAQKMRRQENVSLATVANLPDEFDHSLTRRRIKSVGWLVEKDQSRPVNDSLGEFGELFH